MTSLKQRAVAGEPWLEARLADHQRPLRATTNKWQPHGPEQRLLKLTRTIETEVIPRLLLAERQAASSAPAIIATHEEIHELAELLLAADGKVVSSFVEAFRDRGMRFDALFLDLLAPTARHLGDLWCDDVLSFSEVTLGLIRLQQVLRELTPGFHDEVAPRCLNRRALLVPVPGEQHTFGLNMVAEFFRRAGWDVWCMPLTSEDKLAQIVRRKWFAVVGLSLGSETRVDQLVSSIRAVRRASRNRAVGVMVGGPILVEHPDLAPRVGADATAGDGCQAAIQAERMLDLLAING